MEQRTVRKLERELEAAIAEVVIVRNKKWKYPLLPDRHTLQMMAKAAAAVYEVAVGTGKQERAATDPKRAQFTSAYEGQPPWDLGQPQQPFVTHADRITGSVLDAGCGTGDNALFFAARGQEVLGIDFIAAPLNEARRKARERSVSAEFRQLDALQLATLNQTFDSVIDCGLFHVLSDEDRVRYVAGLAHVTKPGGRFFLMCFSNEQPGSEGPRRISQAEIRQAFADGWTVESIAPTRFGVNPHADRRLFGDGGPKAWFAVIRRL